MIASRKNCIYIHILRTYVYDVLAKKKEKKIKRKNNKFNMKNTIAVKSICTNDTYWTKHMLLHDKNKHTKGESNDAKQPYVIVRKTNKKRLEDKKKHKPAKNEKER